MFPDYIDNTTREAAAICMMKAKRSFIDEIAPEAKSVHLHAGAAMAKGLEIARRAYFEQGLSIEQSITAGVDALIEAYGDFQPPPASYKTADNMANALRYYFKVFPLGMDGIDPILLPSGKRALECRFKVPIPDLVHPDHGGPIYYVGRPDMIPSYNGMIAIEDDKTASSLGESWRKQWDLDSQSTGYVWAMQEQFGITTETVLIRGISILSPKYNDVPISAAEYESAVDAGQVYNKTDKRGATRYYRREYDINTSFGRDQALVYRPAWMVDRWLRQLKRDLSRLIHAYLNDEWDYALHKSACAAYGGCPYKLLCESPQPEKWIPVHYVHRKWDPLASD
jgi:hypothetical protein